MILITIRKNSTGEQRQYADDQEWDGNFIWSEGNFGCDCNRHLFFERASGKECDDDFPCGTTEYTVISIIRDGEVLYEETPCDQISPA